MANARKTGKGKGAASPMLLTKMRIYAVGGFRHISDGQKSLAGFCADVEQGIAPDAEMLRRVAKALEHFVTGDGSSEERGLRVAKALGVIRRQGKGVRSGVDENEMIRSVMEMEDLIAEIGKTEAFKLSKERFGVGERSMRSRMERYGKDVPDYRRLTEQMNRIAGHVLSKRSGSQKKK